MNKKEPSKNCHRQIPSAWKFVLLFICAGIVIGYEAGILLKSSLYASIISIYNNIISQIDTLEISSEDIFWLAMKRNGKYILLLYILCLTNIWKHYYCAFSLYTGFSNGLLLSFNIILHGISGILNYFCFIFPQVLVFVPLYLIIIRHCDNFHIDYQLQGTHTKKGKLLIQQFPFILFNILVVSLGCLVEAYLNMPLIIWIN